MSKELADAEQRFVVKPNRLIPMGVTVTDEIVRKAKILAWCVYDRMEACYPYRTPELGVVGQDFKTEAEAAEEVDRLNGEHSFGSTYKPSTKKAKREAAYAKDDTPTEDFAPRKRRAKKSAAPPAAVKKIELEPVVELADYGDLSDKAAVYAKEL